MKLTWFGHSAFRLDVAGAAVMIDPYLDNPSFKGDRKAAYAGATHVLLTHGHDDHVGSTLDIVKETGATLFALVELAAILQGLGAPKVVAASFGGDVTLGPLAVSLVPAVHTTSMFLDNKPVYAGNPAGLIVRAPGEKTLLHMGDTTIFGDMALIHELHAPKIGIVPIGGHYTMGSKLAALACKRYFEFDTVIPCHYGTFPALEPDAESFRREMAGNEANVLVPERGVAVSI